jgi:hypothetical protein
MSCVPSFETEYLPINPSLCGATCRGCQFNAVVSTSCTEDGCSFNWTVNRSQCTSQPDADFSGSATLAPGDTRQVDFYCDPQESCARFRLTLGCTVNAGVNQP